MTSDDVINAIPAAGTFRGLFIITPLKQQFEPKFLVLYPMKTLRLSFEFLTFHGLFPLIHAPRRVEEACFFFNMFYLCRYPDINKEEKQALMIEKFLVPLKDSR